jgi:hypothetical protein
MRDAANIAENFSRTLLGCGPDWLPNLPLAFRHRHIELTTLSAAVDRPATFIKSAITKHISGKVWNAEDLRREAARHNSELLVLVADPVKFTVEYRCFIAEGCVVTASPYRRFGQMFDDAALNMGEPPEEAVEAQQFASTVVQSEDVNCPPAFVLDVGYIENCGWAVVEANECWASGIYHCSPVKVLGVLTRACIPNRPKTAEHDLWDFSKHYATAVPE